MNNETIQQSPCLACGKSLREQMKGCNEIACYRQHFNKVLSLEEAAKEHSERFYPDGMGFGYELGFKAGAEWQAEQPK